MTRRARVPLLTGVPLLFAGAAAGQAAMSAPPALERHAFEHAAMGTRFAIILYAPSDGSARAAAEAAFARIDELDASLSDYRSGSELRRLEIAAAGGATRVGDDLWAVLVEARLLAGATEGAFDPTVGALTRLWRWAARRGVEPAPARVAAARSTVGFDRLALDDETRSVRIVGDGVRLDLGGIAKGYAVDEAFEILVRRGHAAVLVDGGGDLQIGAPPPGAQGWRVALPRVDGDDPDPGPAWKVELLSHIAVATSGATYRSLETAHSSRSHVIDPRSGFGVRTDRIVSVMAPTAMRADGLASAISVLGPEGVAVARSLGAHRATVTEEAPAATDEGDDDGS